MKTTLRLIAVLQFAGATYGAYVVAPAGDLNFLGKSFALSPFLLSAVASVGLFRIERWGLVLSILVQAAQVFIFSTSIISMKFLLGAGLGIGVGDFTGEILNTRIAVFWNYGTAFEYTLGKPNAQMLQQFFGYPVHNGILVNLLPLLLGSILLIGLRKVARAHD